MRKICWNITSNCNKKCKYCFRCNDEQDLSFDENLEILYKLKTMNVEKINWSGGEPTLYPQIEKLFKRSHELGLVNCMVTNASNLTLENIEKFLGFLDEITFSIDFISDSENEKYGRGNNYFAHVKEIIKILNEKYPNCKVNINTVVMKQNIKNLEQIFDEIKQFKISKWKLMQFSPLRGLAIINQEKFEIDAEEYNNTVKKIQLLESNFEIKVHNYESMIKSHVVISPHGNISGNLNRR